MKKKEQEKDPEKIMKCNCSTIECHRWKDLCYGEDDWCTTVYVDYCPVCGEIKKIYE